MCHTGSPIFLAPEERVYAEYWNRSATTNGLQRRSKDWSNTVTQHHLQTQFLAPNLTWAERDQAPVLGVLWYISIYLVYIISINHSEAVSTATHSEIFPFPASVPHPAVVREQSVCMEICNKFNKLIKAPAYLQESFQNVGVQHSLGCCGEQDISLRLWSGWGWWHGHPCTGRDPREIGGTGIWPGTGNME